MMAAQCPDSGRSGGVPERALTSAKVGQLQRASAAVGDHRCLGQSPDCPERGPVKAIAARQLPALTGVRVLRILGPEVPLRARIRAASRATEARRVAARRRAELTPAAAEVGPGPSGSRRGRDSRRGGCGGWVPSSPPAPALPSSVLQPIRRPPWAGGVGPLHKGAELSPGASRSPPRQSFGDSDALGLGTQTSHGHHQRGCGKRTAGWETACPAAPHPQLGG